MKKLITLLLALSLILALTACDNETSNDPPTSDKTEPTSSENEMPDLDNPDPINNEGEDTNQPEMPEELPQGLTPYTGEIGEFSLQDPPAYMDGEKDSNGFLINIGKLDFVLPEDYKFDINDFTDFVLVKNTVKYQLDHSNLELSVPLDFEGKPLTHEGMAYYNLIIKDPITDGGMYEMYYKYNGVQYKMGYTAALPRQWTLHINGSPAGIELFEVNPGGYGYGFDSSAYDGTELPYLDFWAKDLYDAIGAGYEPYMTSLGMAVYVNYKGNNIVNYNGYDESNHTRDYFGLYGLGLDNIRQTFNVTINVDIVNGIVDIIT